MATQWKRCIGLAWLCMIPVSGNAATPMVSLGKSIRVSVTFPWRKLNCK